MSRRPRPALSPEAAAVVRALNAGGRLSRRSFLGGLGALGAGAGLAACGTKGSSSAAGTSAAAPASSAVATGGSTGTPASASASAGTAIAGPSAATDRSDTEKLVRWANWTLYLDYDEQSKTYPTLENFIKVTGIKATYAEDIEDNDSYYGKIQAQLRNGQDIGKDLIVLTDWMASRVVKAGWTQKLDQDVLPNAGKNILTSLKGDNVSWDPGRDYSYTWQSGYTGLGFNVAELKKLTGKSKITTIDELWDPRLKGRIEVLSEMRDTIGLIMLAQGADVTKNITDAAWSNALAVLEKQLASGQIRQVKGNSYKEDLVSKDAVAVIGWSGDLLQLNLQAKAKNSSLKVDPFGFEIPASGGMLWSDNLLVPIGSPHKKNAETLINYYYEPKIAAEVANYVNYICPVQGAQEEIRKLANVDPNVANSSYIFPKAEDLAKVHTFATLTDAQTTSYTASFQKLLGV